MTAKSILLLIVLSTVSYTYLFGQKFTNRTLRNFHKAEKAFEAGKLNRASKLYHGILKRQPHGMSLKRVGDLELMKGDTATAIMNYYSALEFMNSELEFFNSNLPGYHLIDDINEWIQSTEGTISTIEMAALAKPPSTPERREPAGIKTDGAIVPEMHQPAVMISIEHEEEGFIISGLPYLVKVFSNGAKTSYYDYKDNPLVGWEIPDFQKLSEIIRAISNRPNIDRLADSINWGDDDKVVFISSSTTYDEFNTIQFRGYMMDKISRKMNEINIDPGGFATVILIK